MQIARNRTMATLIALFLMLAMAISAVALPTANAQATRKTYCFIGATPNPVGVGQDVLIHIGITLQLQLVGMEWVGLTVTVTRPDGTTETLGPFRTDSTGGTGTVYVPTMVGNYTLQTHFPQQVTTATNYAPGATANTTMLASDSPKLTLVVQQEPIKYYPDVPLPTEYWTRPINQQFREWYTVAGSWYLSAARVPAGTAGWTLPYNEAPETPHILWTKPLTTGGLAGGTLGLVGSGATSVGMETGDAYEGKWFNRLILAGKLYYQDGYYDRPRLFHCVDLRTGEELWAKTFLDNQTIAFGQLFYWQSYNYQGVFPYLWVTVGTTWTAFDAFTGEWMATITDMPTGTRIEGPRGEIYIYTVSLTGGYMQLWNMSAFISMAGSWGSAFSLREYNASSGTYRSLLTNGTLGSVVTTGAADRAKRAWAWNITIPKGLPGSVREINWTDGRVVGSNVNTTDVNIWAFAIPPIGKESPEPDPPRAGPPGTLLYNNNWKAPAAWAAGNETLSWVTADLTTNIGLVWSKETFQHYGFDLKTGAYLWVTEPMHYLNTYTVGRYIYEGKLYASGMSGIVHCYNLTTGKTIWTYEARDPYQAEILWSVNWPVFIYQLSGGKIYLFHTEHSVNQPLPRGAPAICLNATTGEEIWRVNGLFRATHWGGAPIMGDSVIAMHNTYDQQVYAIGKGPSATTVTASPKVSVHGSSVLVEGTVTDVSPGTKQTAVTLRFPNGVPAVSDESVGEWMKYVYMQFPRPADAVGVEVTLDTVDPNGNWIHIGTVTSDSSGMFKKMFTPEVPGEYTIIATFPGSRAYYASFAETAIGVSEAPPATPPPEQPQAPPDNTALLYGILAAVVVAIIISIYAALRKRP